MISNIINYILQAKHKNSGMTVSDLKRLKELEVENRRLKTMYANISLDNTLLKELFEKILRINGRQLISDPQQRNIISVSRAYKLMSVSKTMVCYKSKKKADDLEISLFLTSLAELHIRWSFGNMMQKVKLEKKPWNHKCVYRVCCKLKLNIRIKSKKKLPLRQAKPLVQPINPNVCWSIDFISDVLRNSRRFKMFNVIDDCNREGLLPNYSLLYETGLSTVRPGCSGTRKFIQM